MHTHGAGQPAVLQASASSAGGPTVATSHAGMMVLGIDPGSRVTGWGVVHERSGVLRLVDCGAVRTMSSASTHFSLRLAQIFHELTAVLHRHAIDEAAAEQVFTAKNAATALKLGQARGAAVAACASQGIMVHDYAPTLIKKSLVGTGGADKAQVAFMVGRLLNVKADWKHDVSDALAVAICHLTMQRFQQRLPQ